MTTGTQEPWGLDRTVAEAADAWISDPRDHEAYRRLVHAVLARRHAHQSPQEAADLPPPEEESFDEPPARPIGDDLRGPPQEVVSHLRADAPDPTGGRASADEDAAHARTTAQVQRERLRAIRERLHADAARAPQYVAPPTIEPPLGPRQGLA